MIQITKAENCCGCEACMNSCPKQCIEMQIRDGFRYPKVNESLCINCGLCEKVCPERKVRSLPLNFPKKGFAARIKDDNARFNSTSGGVAYLLAKTIISNGGIAYGVVFDDQFHTVLGRVDHLQDITALQGSKYPQCHIGFGFKMIRKDLEENRVVIVFGTPCQIQGLSLFLQKDYANLILVDIICHGVPSPIIWEKYLNGLFPNGQIQKVVFKHKMNGWKRWNVFIKSESGTHIKEKTDDLYMWSYLSGLNVRPSCLSCRFKGENRVSDITIADAWGNPENNNALNDGKGLSTLIVNTKKGLKIFDAIESNIIYHSYSVSELTVGNSAYYNCILRNPLRTAFIRELDKHEIIDVLKRYSSRTFRGKVSVKLAQMLSGRRK